MYLAHEVVAQPMNDDMQMQTYSNQLANSGKQLNTVYIIQTIRKNKKTVKIVKISVLAFFCEVAICICHNFTKMVPVVLAGTQQ